uniref:Uncharacterized protein n=1 Tax=Setaria digitata TaxID=48799 RepID=A0A915PEM8_9BILA
MLKTLCGDGMFCADSIARIGFRPETIFQHRMPGQDNMQFMHSADEQLRNLTSSEC